MVAGDPGGSEESVLELFVAGACREFARMEVPERRVTGALAQRSTLLHLAGVENDRLIIGARMGLQSRTGCPGRAVRTRCRHQSGSVW